MSADPEIRIGVIGDLHSFWDERDVSYFDGTNYHLLYFTGDLGGGTVSSSLRMARVMARLNKHALVMPGNNDTGDIDELSAELNHRQGIRKLTAIRTGAAADLMQQPTQVRLCGYSLHRLCHDALDVTLLAARPHSLGGPELSFPDYMRATYGVASLSDSSERLKQLVRDAPSRDLVFFAHNGPKGLGADPNDMWGCDFKADGGDWGDQDLTDAIDYARACGKRVLAVVAGHMHLGTRCGRERPWLSQRDGITYVNAARVPRIFADGSGEWRHHVALTVGAHGVAVREVVVEG